MRMQLQLINYQCLSHTVQEGHSVFATKEDAATEVMHILDIYTRLFKQLLAVPVLQTQVLSLLLSAFSHSFDDM
jgi:hypothetical protein